jgi:hypothetical protein
MLELWIVLGAAAWLALMTLVVALCTASGRADRDLLDLRPALKAMAHARGGRPHLRRI